MIAVSPGEGGAHDGALAVEDVLGRGLLELGVPDEADAVGVVRRVVAAVVGGQQQLGVRRAPVQARHAAPARPARVAERAHQRQPRH